MDDPLSKVAAVAFADELEKLGFMNHLRALGAQAKLLGSRLAHPIQGMAEGWKSLSPRGILEQGGELGQDLWRRGVATNKSKGVLRKNFGTGIHLFNESHVPKNKIQAAAEELSRSGWTGKSRVSKYLPIGDKSQLVLGTAGAVPGVVRAAREGDTGRGGAAEQTGMALGTLGGGVLTAGIRPSLAIPAGLLGAMAVGHMGRKIDQLRAPPVPAEGV